MFTLQLPSFLIFGDRPGLIVGDEEVSLVVWRGGELQEVEIFPNNEKGLALFDEHLKENLYRGKGFFVLSNVIGEDYRREHVAHLPTLDAMKFHNQRMRSLFRGSSFFMADVQGREERGKREDIVLFFGILAATKIDPWLAAINKDSGRYVTGVHGMPYAVSYLRSLLPKANGGDSVIVTFHEHNTMRLTFYDHGKLRFSRVARVAPDADPATLAETIRKELDRTLQYLNTLRAFVEGQLTVDCICPGSMTATMTESLPSAGRMEYRFHSAEALQEKAGIKKSLTESGRDSSLQVHALCKRVILRQLAPQSQLTPYMTQLGARAAMVLFCFYGVYAYASAGITFSEGFFSYVAENEQNQSELDRQKEEYQREVLALGDKPSTGQNVRAVATTFNTIESRGLTPTRLLYYLSGAVTQSGDVEVDNVKWYVSPGATAPVIEGAQFVSGGDFYQILEVQGRVGGQTQRQVAANGRAFVDAFEAQGDIFIEELDMPPEELGFLLDEDASLDRTIMVRLIWRDGVDFPSGYNPRAEEEIIGEAG